MSPTKSPLQIYQEKMAQEHTLPQIKEAFDGSSYAVCFACHRGHVRAVHELFAAIWECNHDVMIVKVDLCIMAAKPVVWHDQLLLIDTNGNAQTANTVAKFMTKSGIVAYEYRIVNEDGVKVCFGSADVKKKSPIERFKGNLLIDGDRLLLTARPFPETSE